MPRTGCCLPAGGATGGGGGQGVAGAALAGSAGGSADPGAAYCRARWWRRPWTPSSVERVAAGFPPEKAFRVRCRSHRSPTLSASRYFPPRPQPGTSAAPSSAFAVEAASVVAERLGAAAEAPARNFSVAA